MKTNTCAHSCVYGALADRIALLLLDGRVPPEARLPSERELAAQLGLSRTTVAAAYAQLRTRGYLRSVRGSGSMTNLPQESVSPHASTGATQLDFSKAALPAACRPRRGGDPGCRRTASSPWAGGV